MSQGAKKPSSEEANEIRRQGARIQGAKEKSRQGDKEPIIQEAKKSRSQIAKEPRGQGAKQPRSQEAKGPRCTLASHVKLRLVIPVFWRINFLTCWPSAALSVIMETRTKKPSVPEMLSQLLAASSGLDCGYL